jgi:hypothetical protein
MKTMAVACFLAVFLLSAHAADLSGSYTWGQTDAERAGIEKAVSDSADSASVFIRPIVRKKLGASTFPYTNILIAVTDNAVHFNRDFSANPIKGTLSGPAVAWTRNDGKTFQVTYAMDGAALKQTFTNEDGSRVNVFTLSPDGARMTMAVTITAEAFKVPVSYSLTYTKNGPPESKSN